MSEAGGFFWSVELPDRKSRAFGGPGPHARVVLRSSEGGDETWCVPVSVGKVLKKDFVDGTRCICSRAELAFEVKRISTDCGRLRVESLVNKRDYSFKELFDKLRLDGYGQEVAGSLCERARSAGVIDDSRFAQSFIRSKIYSGWGQVKIERELSRKGIDVHGLDGWPEDFFDPVDERERARQLASRRRVTGKNDLQKIARYLCGKGFSPSVAFDAAKDALRDLEEC